MIIVHLSGGLGNQLFQYAAGKSLALHHHTQLKLDVSWYKKDRLRKCELSFFNLPLSVAVDEEINPFTKRGTLLKIADRLKPSYKRTIYKEPHFHFDPSFFNASANTYLKGYWQSEKYFGPYSSVLRNELSIGEQYIQAVMPYASRLSAENSVAVHFRRGDYLDRKALEYHGVLSMDYYNTAIGVMANLIPDARFYFFSDDMEWVKSNITIDQPCEYLSAQVTKSAIEDFYLMSRCQHNIIANSSFSWWAGWLNANPQKLVIAPQKWFNKSNPHTRDLVPDRWLRV